jgi:hypothetical protein
MPPSLRHAGETPTILPNQAGVIIRAVILKRCFLKMILKIALLMWFVALALSFVAKAEGRTWMIRLLIGGFCLLLLGFFLKIFSRMLLML